MKLICVIKLLIEHLFGLPRVANDQRIGGVDFTLTHGKNGSLISCSIPYFSVRSLISYSILAVLFTRIFRLLKNTL